MVETIKVPANVNYLNEWAGFELPRGIVNKGITGCGATTLAIEDEHKTIICSPRINLIKNKCQQHKGTLAVYGDVRNGDIEDYLRNSPKPKLLATYDSVPRLNGLIKDKSDWRIVVDEYQYLLIDSGFKSETEIALLETLKEFPYVTYLSATPIADKYMRQMEWFKDLPYTVLEWSNVEQRFVKRVQSKNPINNAIEIVRNYQKGIYPFVIIDGEKIESKECVSLGGDRIVQALRLRRRPRVLPHRPRFPSHHPGDVPCLRQIQELTLTRRRRGRPPSCRA